MSLSCPNCGCNASSAAHTVAGALRAGDVDAALDAGLLDVTPCPACRDECTAALLAARASRLAALAARDRFRAREARLARRRQEREARRANAALTPVEGTPTPSLPPAAAAALARAKARAAGRTPR